MQANQLNRIINNQVGKLVDNVQAKANHVVSISKTISIIVIILLILNLLLSLIILMRLGKTRA